MCEPSKQLITACQHRNHSGNTKKEKEKEKDFTKLNSPFSLPESSHAVLFNTGN